MNAAGYPATGNGNGSGAPTNSVKLSPLYLECRAQIEADHPRAAAEKVFQGIQAFMVICDVRNEARYIGGSTYLLQTPEGFSPLLMVYFTYASGQIVMQAVHAAG